MRCRYSVSLAISIAFRKTLLGVVRRRGVVHQDRFALDPIKSRLFETCSRPFNSRKLLVYNCKSLVGAAYARVDLRKNRLDWGGGLRGISGSRLQLGDPLLRLAKFGHRPAPECPGVLENHSPWQAR